MTKSTIVLITGANSGIGYATARTIASHPNYHVLMGSRDCSKGEAACARLRAANLPGKLSVVQLDVEDDVSISTAVDTISAQYGRIDVFVSNAGTIARNSTGRNKIEKIFSTNVFGAMLTTEAFIPLLIRSHRPCLIQISSALGSLALASDATEENNAKDWHESASDEKSTESWHEYLMSKTALNMMTIQLHKRLKCRNVRVFAFCPGLVRTDIWGASENAVFAEEYGVDPMEPASVIMDIITGKRDEDVGMFLHENGTYPW